MMGTRSPRVRAVLVTAGLAALLLILTQFVFPGDQRGNGTPTALVFSGVVFGLLNALTAVALVIVYRTTRVINFAQTALGALGAELTFQLLQIADAPFFVALPAGVITAGLAGLLFDVVIGRRFFRAPRLVLTVATIATAGLIAGLARRAINSLPFLPREEATLDQLAGLSTLRDDLPLRDFSFTIGEQRIPFGFAEVFAVVAAVTVLVAIGAFFRYSRTGVAVRAMAENTERASLMGMSVGALSSTVWVMAGVLSGVGLILTGILTTPAGASGVAPEVLLPALAAAVVARMRSVTVAALAAVGLSVLAAAWDFSFPSDGGLYDVVLFLIIGVGLLVQRETILRSDDGGVTWEATEEQRPVPRELLTVPGVRLTRYALVAIGLAAVVLYPWLVTIRAIQLGAVIATFAIVALSVLVLTGWAGQVSLGQFAFVAIGTVVGGALTSTVGLSFWLAVPVATAVTSGIAVLIGIPALRIRGLFLAISTFALAIAVRAVLFDERYFGWLLPDRVDRPTLFLLDFADERSMYYLTVASLLLATIVVVNLRRSRSGRMLIAVRENDANLQSFGVGALRTKLLAFAVSGALAGFAGAVFAHLQRGVSADSFVPQRSVDVLLLAVLGGVTSIGGVLLGSIAFNAREFFLTGNVLFAIISPFAVILLLFIEPGGLIGLVNRVRDSVLRIVAQRRQMVVPSLFADQDPEALARRLIPLAEPIPRAGLDALPPDQRFALSSRLYANGHGTADIARPRRVSDEAALIGAAAEAAEEAT